MSEETYKKSEVKQWRRLVIFGYIILIVGASLTISLTVSYYQGRVETQLRNHEERLFDYVNQTCKPVRNNSPG